VSELKMKDSGKGNKHTRQQITNISSNSNNNTNNNNNNNNDIVNN